MSQDSPSYRQAMMDSGRAHWHGGQAVGRELTPDEKAWVNCLTDEERKRLAYEEELAARSLDDFYQEEDDE